MPKVAIGGFESKLIPKTLLRFLGELWPCCA